MQCLRAAYIFFCELRQVEEMLHTGANVLWEAYLPVSVDFK